MLLVGLTGGIGSGKSTVADLLAAKGAVVLDADAITRELQRPGTEVHAAIVRRFGPGVLLPDGGLDRAALRDWVLADPGARQDLESIVHPAVAARRAELVAAAREQGVPVIVSEIPLLFEALDPAAFDAVVLVEAPESVRRRRLMEQRGLAHAEADRLIAAQMPSPLKRGRSRFVIENGGSPDQLERRSRAVWEALAGPA